MSPGGAEPAQRIATRRPGRVSPPIVSRSSPIAALTRMPHRSILALAPLAFLVACLVACQTNGDVLFPPGSVPDSSPPVAEDAALEPDSAGPEPAEDAAFMADSSGPEPAEDAAFTPDSSGPSLDAGVLSCVTAPTIVARDYDQTCDVDSDCVAVPQGGSVCDPCLFLCPAAALTSNGAVQYAIDYRAALSAYASSNAQTGCSSGCQVFPGPCCRNRACVVGDACLLDATAPTADY
jgi:hypothetical protein